MTEEKNQRVMEEFDDAALELLMNEYAEIEGAALWREFQAAEAAGKNPQMHEREYRESSRGSRQKGRRIDTLKHVGKGFKRVAAIFLILVCLLSPVVMPAEAFKLPVLNYILAISQKFSGFNFGVEDKRVQKNEDVVELIRSVICPDGYYFSRQEVTDYGKIWVYFKNENNDIIRISVYPSDGKLNIDTEDVNQVSTKVLDYDAVYLQKDGYRVIWMDAKRQLIFSVHAYALEEDVFWKYVYTLAEKLSQ